MWKIEVGAPTYPLPPLEIFETRSDGSSMRLFLEEMSYARRPDLAPTSGVPTSSIDKNTTERACLS
jgi:hypothetical protein